MNINKIYDNQLCKLGGTNVVTVNRNYTGVASLVDTTWSETRVNTTTNVVLLGDS